MKKDTDSKIYSKEVYVLGDNLVTLNDDEYNDSSNFERNLLDCAINIKMDLVRYLNKQGLPLCEYMTIHDIIHYLQT